MVLEGRAIKQSILQNVYVNFKRTMENSDFGKQIIL